VCKGTDDNDDDDDNDVECENDNENGDLWSSCGNSEEEDWPLTGAIAATVNIRAITMLMMSNELSQCSCTVDMAVTVLCWPVAHGRRQLHDVSDVDTEEDTEEIDEDIDDDFADVSGDDDGDVLVDAAAAAAAIFERLNSRQSQRMRSS